MLAWHGFATVAWLSGSATLMGLVGQERVSAYINPMFAQNWSVFAPEPSKTNSELSVQGRLEDGSTTDWFNVSAIDVEQSILHHPVPSRLYLTNFSLMAHYEGAVNRLPQPAQSVPTESYVGTDWLTELKSALPAGTAPAETDFIETYVKNERAITGLSASIARVRWEQPLQAVRFRIVNVDVPLYAERDNAEYRPEPEEFISGWREPVPVPGMDLEALEHRYGQDGDQ